MGPRQKLVAHKLNRIDLSDSAVLQDFLLELEGMEREMFDNYQTRFMSRIKPGAWLTAEHLRQALTTLTSFDFVGVTERLEESVHTLSRLLSWDPPDVLPRLNQNTNSSLIQLADPEHHRILRAVTAYDQALYDEAAARVGLGRRNVA
jgi:hypothetical protein